MADETLASRGRALDDAFYGEDAGELRERLHGDGAVAALADASGIADESVLARLAGLGIRPDTLAALTLIPLVEVAWADGRMERREIEAVLAGAESTGLAAGSPSHGLLRIWLEERPPVDLVEAWKAYIRALASELSDGQRKRLRDNILDRARAVAEAAGGFLGLGNKVSREEEAALEDLGLPFDR